MSNRRLGLVLLWQSPWDAIARAVAKLGVGMRETTLREESAATIEARRVRRKRERMNRLAGLRQRKRQGG